MGREQCSYRALLNIWAQPRAFLFVLVYFFRVRGTRKRKGGLLSFAFFHLTASRRECFVSLPWIRSSVKEACPGQIIVESPRTEFLTREKWRRSSVATNRMLGRLAYFFFSFFFYRGLAGLKAAPDNQYSRYHKGFMCTKESVRASLLSNCELYWVKHAITWARVYSYIKCWR